MDALSINPRSERVQRSPDPPKLTILEVCDQVAALVNCSRRSPFIFDVCIAFLDYGYVLCCIHGAQLGDSRPFATSELGPSVILNYNRARDLRFLIKFLCHYQSCLICNLFLLWLRSGGLRLSFSLRSFEVPPKPWRTKDLWLSFSATQRMTSDSGLSTTTASYLVQINPNKSHLEPWMVSSKPWTLLYNPRNTKS